jgi:hypothetical protein
MIRPRRDGEIGLGSDDIFHPGEHTGGMADVRVLIVDDVEQVRQDLRTLLTLAGGIEVVAEAGNGLDAISSPKLRP